MARRVGVLGAVWGATLWGAMVAVPGSLFAQEAVAPPAKPSRERADPGQPRQRTSPYTQAEVGLGVLTLPTTDVCLTAPRSCTRGDASAQGYLWMLYRASTTYAVGAGASYAPPVKSDQPQPSGSNLERTHTRQYLLIDVVGRYYALRLEWLEGWVGMTAGGVVVRDRFKTETQNLNAPILGPSGGSVRTEGLTAGIAAGIGWTFAANWSVEGAFRSAWWFLPSEKSCTPTLDCATLSDDVAMFTLSAGVAYRISL